jgi:hypothetical protein
MLGKLGRLVAPMQAWLDAAEFVDDIVVAACQRDAAPARLRGAAAALVSLHF